MLKTFPNYFLILNQDSSKNVNFSWKNNFTKILVKLIANYTTKISWFFPVFPWEFPGKLGTISRFLREIQNTGNEPLYFRFPIEI